MRRLFESAGFTDVRIEDRYWDEGDSEAKDTRRPDIVAFNPRNRKRYVIDVVGAWAGHPGGAARGKWRVPGKAADAKAAGKWTSYRGALARQETGGRGWMVKTSLGARDEFVPFAFEVGGALGREAEDLIGEAVSVAEYNRKGLGDLAHWSALNWEGHWRQRIGVEIMRGVARCIQRSADSSSMVASVSGRRRNLEYDRHCC